MYSFVTIRSKPSSRSHHQLASEVDGHSESWRQPSVDLDKNTAEATPQSIPTSTGHVNTRKDIAAFRKRKIPLQIITKDLSLPAPTPIQPSSCYVYGDLSAQAYPPVAKRAFSTVRARTALQINIKEFLSRERSVMKSDIVLLSAQLLDDSDDEDRKDLISLFAGRHSKTLLPTELAMGIVSKQALDEQWRASMRASQDSVSGIHTRMKYLGEFRNSTCYVRPGPSKLASQVFATAPASPKDDNDSLTAVASHSRSESASSSGTASSGETLVDDEAMEGFAERLTECMAKGRITVRKVKARCRRRERV